MPRRREIYSSSRLSQERWDAPKRRGKILPILLLVSAGICVFAFYSYWSVSKKTDKIAENLQLNGQNVNNPSVLIEKVSRLILLPKDETPSVATINNVVQLQKSWSFYENARNGDVLLIYFQAKKAYIYDPVENIIVNMGSVDVAVATVRSASSTTSTP